MQRYHPNWRAHEMEENAGGKYFLDTNVSAAIAEKEEGFQEVKRLWHLCLEQIAALQAEIAILKTKNAGWIKFSCDHRCELRKKLDVSQDVGMQESMEVVRLQAALAVSDKAAIEWQHRCMQIDMELSTAKAHIKEKEEV
jgi:hypothetical protein